MRAFTDGVVEEGTVVMTEARRNTFPTQRNLKLYLGGLRVARISHRIKDYYRLIKDLLAIAFRPCTDFNWSEPTEYAWRRLVDMVGRVRKFDSITERAATVPNVILPPPVAFTTRDAFESVY